MPPDPVQELLASVRTRLEAELAACAPALTTRLEQSVSDAKKAAEAEAESRWSALLATHKTQADEQLRAALDAARADVRLDALHAAVNDVDRARTLAESVDALSRGAAAVWPGARLFVGPAFEPWRADGGEPQDDPSALLPLLREAAASGRASRDERRGFAIPIVLDEAAVAVLHAPPSDAKASASTLELLARHAAAHLGLLTAVRLGQAQRWIALTGIAPSAPETEPHDQQSAKRYARLLVSEIKLYNEGAVRDGRTNRDLARRLGPEIERARRVYDERVPPSVSERARLFEHELVQTLAGGDPALLG